MRRMHGHPREKDWERICASHWEPFIFPGCTSNPEQLQIVEEAISEVRRKLIDFDKLSPLMLAVAKGLIPDLGVLTAAQYIEAVYCYGKFSDLCAPLREKLLEEAVPMISTRTM
jgi:hypothetical protein